MQLVSSSKYFCFLTEGNNIVFSNIKETVIFKEILMITGLLPYLQYPFVLAYLLGVITGPMFWKALKKIKGYASDKLTSSDTEENGETENATDKE